MVSNNKNLKPIHVLCVLGTLNRGGAETLCMNLFRTIDRSKIMFDFVKHTEQECAYDKEIINLGGKIYSAPRFKVFNYLSYIKWWNKFYKSHPEISIVHGHLTNLGCIYLRIAKKYSLKTVLHSHALDHFDSGIASILRRAMALRSPKYADSCISCGKEAGEWIFKNREFKILKNGIIPENFRYDAVKYDSSRRNLQISNKFVVGVVGSIKEVKNPFGTLAIFEKLLNKQPNSYLLWLGDGDMINDVRKYIFEHRLENNICLIGSTSEVGYFMSAMDIFIMPSLSEGFPVVAIEAQASGMRCYFSNNVPKEVDITGRCDFLSLSNYDAWIEVIFRNNNSKFDCSSAIDNNGFSISLENKTLTSLYFELM